MRAHVCKLHNFASNGAACVSVVVSVDLVVVVDLDGDLNVDLVACP